MGQTEKEGQLWGSGLGMIKCFCLETEGKIKAWKCNNFFFVPRLEGWLHSSSVHRGFLLLFTVRDVVG